MWFYDGGVPVIYVCKSTESDIASACSSFAPGALSPKGKENGEGLIPGGMIKAAAIGIQLQLPQAPVSRKVQ